MAQCLVWGLVTGVAGVCDGQVRPLSPPAGSPQPGQSINRQPRPDTTTLDSEELSPDLERLLAEWEQKTSGIERLRGVFERYQYDPVFAVEKRAKGKFWYERPDKGRMDFYPAKLPAPTAGSTKPVNPRKVDANGNPFVIEAANPERWICTGKEILQIDDRQKNYSRVEIPPQMQGANIMDGPLPFLFGMKAEKAKARYFLELGRMHNPDGRLPNAARQVHVIARPRFAQDRREWKQAEVLLDADRFLPTAIRLIDPTSTETNEKSQVYLFPSNDMEINTRLQLDNPFSESLRGYELLHNDTAPVRQTGGSETRPFLPGELPATRSVFQP